MNDDFPCRVAAELRLYESQQSEPLRFDPFDDHLMHDIVAVKRLIKPVQNLLIAFSLSQPGDPLYEELKALNTACNDEMMDL